MDDLVQSMLAEAAEALLAGRPQEARTRFEACSADAPGQAILGLAITAWSQGDFLSLRSALARLIEGVDTTDLLPFGFIWTLQGLALVHAGAIQAGLERQTAGLHEARRANDGSEVSAMVAIADALLFLGRLEEARATIAAIEDVAKAYAPVAAMMVERLAIALAVLSLEPDAGHRCSSAVAAAEAQQDQPARTWALLWYGVWLVSQERQEAAGVLEQAAATAVQCSAPLMAAEAHMVLASIEPEPGRAERLSRARMYARASGAKVTEVMAILHQGGEQAWEASRDLETLLAPLNGGERTAFMRWPGRRAACKPRLVDTSVVQRLGGIVRTIASQEDQADALDTALASFVEVVGAERGFLLRLKGFEVVDQVVLGAPPDAYSTSLAGQVILSSQPLIIEDLEAAPELGAAASVQELGLKMAIGLPLLADGEVVGVILADSKQAHPGFSPEALALAQAIADNLVVALHNTEQLARSRRIQTAEAIVRRAALAAAGEVERAAALAAIAREAGDALGIERFFVLMGEALDCQYALDACGQSINHAEPSMGTARWVAPRQRAFVAADAQAEPELAKHPSIRQMSLCTVMAAPIMGPKGAQGVLYMDSRTPPRVREETERIVEGLAAVVSTILTRREG